jgi:hypothetical protein
VAEQNAEEYDLRENIKTKRAGKNAGPVTY